MFSPATAEPLRTYPLHHHERHPSDHLRSYTLPPRPLVDLPRPLEPRPNHTLPSVRPDVSASQGRTGVFRNPPLTQPEYRPQVQNLPRLHDILTSGPPTPSPPSYGSAWSTTAGPAPSHSNGDGYYTHMSGHPPPVQPPHDSVHAYQPQPGRCLELPILETSPVTRHDSHVPPQSPYAGYPEIPREYNDSRRERPRQASTSSYYPNGVPSPYTSVTSEEIVYRSPASAFERPPSNTFTPAGTESSKKYLGIREITGEGAFHFYEGGYRIPTHVDGETVNPAWGLTKANKPRKRLAMACLDCREKKIKCEPGAASCLQCEKAKRPCRKAPLHQFQAESSTAPSWQSGPGSPTRSGMSDPGPSSARETDRERANKRRPTEELSPSGKPTKKHRSASPMYSVDGARGHQARRQSSPMLPRSPGKGIAWEEDPFIIEPGMTLHLLERYFAHVNSATHSLFPRHHFMHWLTSHPHKFQNELLILYAMLAIGSVFADDQYSGFGKHCADIATKAVQATLGRFSMPLVQTRLLLGLYHLARGAKSLAWDYMASGTNAIMYLRYNTEQGCSEGEKTRNEFAFSDEQLIECKRRTMWSAFLMDRYWDTHQSLVCARDIFIRLPSTEDAYERGLLSSAPFYNNGEIDPTSAALTSASPVSPTAWLILVAAIRGDIEHFVHRATYRSPLSYAEEYEQFYEATSTSLHSWASSLPEHLQFKQSNAERSILGGYAGPFVTMHVLSHLSWLKLNRFVRHEAVPKSVTRNVRGASQHAHELLQVMSIFGVGNRQVGEREDLQAMFALTMPVIGDAILSAIDVVGAGGLDPNLKSSLDLISCGLDSLRELGRYWDSARDQNKACEKRYYQIHNVLKHPFTARSGCWLGREWGVDLSMEREIALEEDCIFGLSSRAYFDALKDESPTVGRVVDGGGPRVV